MSRTTSPATRRAYGLKRVCDVWGIARSRMYRERKHHPIKRGPQPSHDDAMLLKSIQDDIATSPFKGEGRRKVHARLRRQGIVSGRNRILSVMKRHGLLSPHRSYYKAPNAHNGRITTDAPNVMWGSDGTKVKTVDEGWVWVFSVIDHWNTECLGWHVCRKGDRFAAYAPISQAIKKIYGGLGRGIATDLKLRIDNGSQYTSDYFLEQVKYLGIETSFGLIRQPETNGVAERFHRTLKEQIVDGRVFRNTNEVREAVQNFVEVYNQEWLVGKRGHRSPVESREHYERLKGVA